MAREKNLESFFLDTENINHLNENYDEDAKSQKEYKDLYSYMQSPQKVKGLLLQRKIQVNSMA